MRVLLDTNALIWWLEDMPRLGPQSRHILANPANTILTSVVSIWEITIKWRVGKMHLPGSDFERMLEEQSVQLLPIDQRHVAAVETLPMHHGDPFDHLILAQTLVEQATLMTSDRQMAQYGVPCIGVS